MLIYSVAWPADDLIINIICLDMITINTKMDKQCWLNINAILKLVDSAKFLDVIFTPTLNWNPHIEERAKKAQASLYVCRSSIWKTWDLSQISTRWMYTSINIPILLYGIMVYQKAMIINTTNINSNTNNLRKVHRTVSIGITILNLEQYLQKRYRWYLIYATNRSNEQRNSWNTWEGSKASIYSLTGFNCFDKKPPYFATVFQSEIVCHRQSLSWKFLKSRCF